MRKLNFVILFLFFVCAKSVFAVERPSFITIVNPVRGRPMWSELSLFKKQAASIHEKNLRATWLVQYNVLEDEDVVELLQSYQTDELGIFLEVSEQLATDSRVPYILGDGDWARADKVFFSGYEIDDRKRMVDTLFEKFKETFGKYPQSVGAWYIDPVTLEYMVEKYGVTAAIDCSDQYATDGYGLWGKPWGVPYYPSRLNSLVPAQTEKNKLPVVKIQWALRDPLRGYGKGVPDSTYSVQPNDYVGHHGLDIEYFKELLDFYLDTLNEYQQATIGLEVGTESQFLDELHKQFEEAVRRKKNGVEIVTMAQFAQWHQNAYPEFSPPHAIFGNDALWYNSNDYRIGLTFTDGNIFVRDIKLYDEEDLNFDLVGADQNHKLYRDVSSPIDELLSKNGKLLAQGATNVHIASGSSELTISWEGTQAGKLHINSTQILFNQETIVDVQKPNPFDIKEKLTKIRTLLAIRLAKVTLPSLPVPTLRYSHINGKRFFGFQTDFEHIFAVSFPPPRVKTFYFPFQTLVRFKTWPSIKIPKLLFPDDIQ